MTAAIDHATRSAIAESARRWVADAYGPARRREALAGGGFDRAAWTAMADQGWFGIGVPEALGGLGQGIGELSCVAQAIGAGALLEPVMAVAGVAAHVLAGVAKSHVLAANWLTELIAGDRIAVLAHTEEKAGFNRDYIETTAVPHGSGWILHGSKCRVEAGSMASGFLVTALVGQEVGLFLIDRDVDRLAIEIYRSLDGRTLADLSFDGVAAGQETSVGVSGGIIEEAIDRGALLVMADAVGAMQVLLDDTIAHLNTRRQFGQPLAKFQALQHRTVDMFIALEEARATVAVAADCRPDNDLEFRLAVATAKVAGGRAARRIAREAVQLHGGIGIAEDLRVSHYFRRLVAAESLYGDPASYIERFKALARA